MSTEITGSRHLPTHEELAARQPRHAPPLVKDVVELRADKSIRARYQGELPPVFAFDQAVCETFFRREEHELALLPKPIAGFSQYFVALSTTEEVYGPAWHRVEQKLVIVTHGQLICRCEDLHGEREIFELDFDEGLWIPSFILCTFEVPEADAVFQVTTNTNISNLDPTRLDRYDAASFHLLQRAYSSPDVPAPAAAESPR